MGHAGCETTTSPCRGLRVTRAQEPPGSQRGICRIVQQQSFTSDKAPAAARFSRFPERANPGLRTCAEPRPEDAFLFRGAGKRRCISGTEHASPDPAPRPDARACDGSRAPASPSLDRREVRPHGVASACGPQEAARASHPVGGRAGDDCSPFDGAGREGSAHTTTGRYRKRTALGRWKSPRSARVRPEIVLESLISVAFGVRFLADMCRN